MIYYLKDITEADLCAAVNAAGLRYVMEDGTSFMAPGCALDIIGPIHPDMSCHANLKTPEPLDPEVLALLPIMDPSPSTPIRVFWEIAE